MQEFIERPLTYKAISRPKGFASFSGKFFDVWVLSNSSCLKWPKTRLEIQDLSRIIVIQQALSVLNLSPMVKDITYEFFRGEFGFIVEHAEVVSSTDTEVTEIEARLSEAATLLFLHRLPYATLPGVDSFVLEAHGKNNIGRIRGISVFIDIDPKCWTDHPLLHANALKIGKNLYNITQTRRIWARIATS